MKNLHFNHELDFISSFKTINDCNELSNYTWVLTLFGNQINAPCRG